MKIVRFNQENSTEWDDFVLISECNSFLYKNDFRAHQKNKFEDVSIIIRDESDGIIGLFPAAISPDAMNMVVSHPGLTFGGLIHKRDLDFRNIKILVEEILIFYRELGYRTLEVRLPPKIYRDTLRDDVEIILKSNNHTAITKVSAYMEINKRRNLSSRRMRTLKKAKVSGMEVERESDLTEFWNLLGDVLRSRHEVEPVHNLDQITEIMEKFPNEVNLYTTRKNGELLAGAVIFKNEYVDHVQYVASSDEGKSRGATDILFDTLINESSKKYFDFGVSNHPDSNNINEGLHNFKIEFGCNSIIYETIKIQL